MSDTDAAKAAAISESVKQAAELMWLEYKKQMQGQGARIEKKSAFLVGYVNGWGDYARAQAIMAESGRN